MARGGVVGGVVGGIISSINNSNNNNDVAFKINSNTNNPIKSCVDNNSQHSVTDHGLSSMRKQHGFGDWHPNKIPMDLFQHLPLHEEAIDHPLNVSKLNMEKVVRYFSSMSFL